MNVEVILEKKDLFPCIAQKFGLYLFEVKDFEVTNDKKIKVFLEKKKVFR